METCDWCDRPPVIGLGPPWGATKRLCDVHRLGPELLAKVQRLRASNAELLADLVACRAVLARVRTLLTNPPPEIAARLAPCQNAVQDAIDTADQTIARAAIARAEGRDDA